MAQIWLSKDDQPPRMMWLVEGHKEQITLSPETLSLSLVAIKPLFMSGLQVRKDPGAFLVYVGCILMILGVFVAFFFTHRRIWVYVEPVGEKKTRVIVGGYSKRYRDDLKRELEHLLTKLQSGLT